jgi:KaiC/GvpD/RAD55 family RecA-like ATPase
LCCEAGTILTLKFSVISTQIETAGEVCYSIPHIGMGIRFLDLEPEHLMAIETLIEIHQEHGNSDTSAAQHLRTIQCGVEPIDKLLGGLEPGHLYLAHGDASGKSLLGIEFLIDGLKHGHPGVLIGTQRREDAARRFARFGYDCSHDLRKGALVLFSFDPDRFENTEHQLHLESLFRELGPVLDEFSPERIVFDPVDILLAGADHAELTELANQLAVWVRSFGATVILVANEENPGVIESLAPSVRNSFRFEVRENFDRVVRFMTFEKSPSIKDQAIRVDPARGIALLEEQPTEQFFLRRPVAEPADSGELQPEKPRVEESGAPEARDAFFAMLDELQSFVSSIDPEIADAANSEGSQNASNTRLPGSIGVE